MTVAAAICFFCLHVASPLKNLGTLKLFPVRREPARSALYQSPQTAPCRAPADCLRRREFLRLGNGFGPSLLPASLPPQSRGQRVPACGRPRSIQQSPLFLPSISKSCPSLRRAPRR